MSPGDRSCCRHLPAVSPEECLGGHHPDCPATQELQAEVRRLRAEVEAQRAEVEALRARHARVAALARPISGALRLKALPGLPTDEGEDPAE